MGVLAVTGSHYAPSRGREGGIRQCSAAIVDVYKIETDDGVSHQNLVTDGIRNIHSLETKDIGLSILVDTCSCCFGRHIAFLETSKCVPVLSPDWRQHRSKSQVDAFTCFGRILNLLEELLLPDRIVECRNDLCSTGQISAQRHIQVAEFRYAGPDFYQASAHPCRGFWRGLPP